MLKGLIPRPLWLLCAANDLLIRNSNSFKKLKKFWLNVVTFNLCMSDKKQTTKTTNKVCSTLSSLSTFLHTLPKRWVTMPQKLILSLSEHNSKSKSINILVPIPKFSSLLVTDKCILDYRLEMPQYNRILLQNLSPVSTVV